MNYFQIIAATCILILFGLTIHFVQSITKTRLAIYTPNDIIFVTGKTVSFETSDDVYKFADTKSLFAFVADITAKDAQYQNWELVSIAENYSAIFIGNDGKVVLKMENPYNDFKWQVLCNSMDTLKNGILYYYTD